MTRLNEALEASTFVGAFGEDAAHARSTAQSPSQLQEEPDLKDALGQINRPLWMAKVGASLRILSGPDLKNTVSGNGSREFAYVPPVALKSLGDQTFCGELGIKYPYLAGAMANGIASEELVEAMGRAGMLGFFGAAGLSLERIEAAIERLQASLGDLPFGFNFIHSPHDSRHEDGVVDLYLRKGVRLVEASAFLGLTLPLVRYRVHGIHRGADGEIVVPNQIVAKASRVEVATKFFSPPPQKMLRQLVEQGQITAEQAEWAKQIPMAQNLTAEADSGGHTDNRPAIALIPTLLALKDRMQREWGYRQTLRVGAAGGISTPEAALAMFAQGAAYVMTGSINQACRESGSSDVVRGMLADAGQADVAMAPAADMFEMGVKVQVLKRGTMFPMRASKLYELYRLYGSIEEIPSDERSSLEKTVFRSTLDEIWVRTKAFFEKRDPAQIERAESDPKHRMALVFRWYLGMSSRWANCGEPGRQMDYQVWCGPAMGAFNEWARGSALERPENRKAVTLAMNILYGTAVLTRVHMLRAQGIPVSAEWTRIEPLTLDAINGRI